MNAMPVLVMTSDRYMEALRPFIYLFNRYWGTHQEARIICFKQPTFSLPDNFSAYSMGPMSNYPIEKWSNALLDYLQAHGEIEHFVLMLEDYWLCRHVNLVAVKMLWDYARQFRNVLKIDLCADRLYAKDMVDYNVCGYIDLVKSHPMSPYHMSLMTGIWNRDLFIKVVQRNQSPWDVEIFGTSHLASYGDEILVLGTRQWPLRHILAHRRGKPEELLLEGLQPNDVTELVQRNLLKGLDQNQLEKLAKGVFHEPISTVHP